MVDDHRFFCFRNGELVEVTDSDDVEVRLAAADSWLVENGRVRALDLHFERFTKAIEKVAPDHVSMLPSFFNAVLALIPQTGDWFPRLEFHSNDSFTYHLHLRLREAPERSDTVTLWTLDEPDPRINPEIKGPDLSLGQQLRRKANLHGADEAVILDRNGHILEGALSSLVWWRDDVLCAPGDDLAWLPSVTREVVFAVAEQAGFKTRTETVTPKQLNGLEIWTLSALHGIRVVTAWDALPDGPGTAEHADSFRRRLKMLSAFID